MSAVDHRVLTHLGVSAFDYGLAIRRYIPAYDEMIANVVALLGAGGNGDGDGDGNGVNVIDLGAGTGALAAAILAAHPASRVKLIDIDPTMLETAATRLASFGARAVCVNASFESELPACDAVVASLSLHHVPTLAEKRQLYTRVRDALRPGGVLAIADITLHAAGAERTRMVDAWASWMHEHGISRPEADALFATWSAEDRYFSLEEELDALRAAGFAHPDCFWKHGPSTVYGAIRE